jgi:hypothetical protein
MDSKQHTKNTSKKSKKVKRKGWSDARPRAYLNSKKQKELKGL